MSAALAPTRAMYDLQHEQRYAKATVTPVYTGSIALLPNATYCVEGIHKALQPAPPEGAANSRPSIDTAQCTGPPSRHPAPLITVFPAQGHTQPMLQLSPSSTAGSSWAVTANRTPAGQEPRHAKINYGQQRPMGDLIHLPTKQKVRRSAPTTPKISPPSLRAHTCCRCKAPSHS